MQIIILSSHNVIVLVTFLITVTKYLMHASERKEGGWLTVGEHSPSWLEGWLSIREHSPSCLKGWLTVGEHSLSWVDDCLTVGEHSLSWLECEAAGHITSAARKQRESSWCSALILPFFSSLGLTHGMILARFRVGLLTSIILI